MATATQPFSKKFLDSYEPEDGKDTVIRDAGQTGLALRVRPRSTETPGEGADYTRTLLVQWYEGKRQRRFKLGRPDEFTSIKAVRDKAAKVLQGIQQGVDPVAEKRARNQEFNEKRTVARLADLYMKNVEQRELLRPDCVEHSLTKYVLPRFGRMLVSDLKRSQIDDWHLGIKSPFAANAALSWLSGMLTFAVRRDWIQYNPASKIERKSTPPRTRYLSADEKARLVEVCKRHIHAGIHKGDLSSEKAQLAAAVVVMMSTGARVTEITDARWTPSGPDRKQPIVDLDNGVIIKRVGKNKRTRVIHLDGTAKDVLSRLQRDNGPVFPKLAGRRSNSFPHTWRALRDEAELKDFQMRDLRRSFATELNNEDGESIDVIAKAMNNTEQVARQVYTTMKDARVAAAVAKRPLIELDI
jgi:integrase